MNLVSNPKTIAACAAFALLFSCSKKEVKAPVAVGPVPDEYQMAWHEMEQNAFIHFTVNTFTDREWGEGSEKEAVFNPTNLDAGQWASTLKQAGFKGVILTCKHHDGFCLWPTKFTEHSVKNSPYKNGKGDMVKELSDAAKKEGLKFGVYLSPWDRNAASYGKPEYIELYRNQLKELLSNYGPVFEMWMDGANGGDGYYGGANETRKIDRKTYYQWPKTLALARELQPGVLRFSDAGPDLRWCGNEEGIGGETNWNTITRDTLYPGVADIGDLLRHGDINGKQWVPAEVNTSIRPGWFYHAKEDAQVKTPQQLFELYLNSVGRGSTLLLNIPPDKRGLFHENDVKSLLGYKKLLDEAFKTDYAKDAKVTADTYRGESLDYAAANVTDGKKETYWTTDDNVKKGSLEVDFGTKKTVKFISLQEYIKLGQRISRFIVEVSDNGSWKKVADGTTVGYKRIFKITSVEAEKVRITIEDAKACPLISNVSVY